MRSGEIWLPSSPAPSASFICSQWLPPSSRGLERKPSPPSCPCLVFPMPACCMGAAEPSMMGTGVGMGILLCPPQARRLLSGIWVLAFRKACERPACSLRCNPWLLLPRFHASHSQPGPDRPEAVESAWPGKVDESLNSCRTCLPAISSYILLFSFSQPLGLT